MPRLRSCSLYSEWRVLLRRLRNPACPGRGASGDIAETVASSSSRQHNDQAAQRNNQRGWALLGAILAVTVLSIMLVGIIPSVQMDVKRSKEEEMVYRGKQMAEGIARYYGAGRLSSLQLSVPPPYGYLYDLKKLSDGVQIGSLQLKFVRHEALVDPMVSKDWVPVRARDPRLMAALQAYAAYNLTTVPQSYILLAAPPSRLILNNPTGDGSGTGSSQGGQTGQNGSSIGGSTGNGSNGSSPFGNQGNNGNQGNTGNQGPQAKASPSPQGEDDDDDDDDDRTKPTDPLAHLLQDSEHGLPIVGVAPNLKGTAVHPLWGMTKYEEWVFIYIPLQQQVIGVPTTTGQPNQPGVGGNGTVRPVQPGGGSVVTPVR
jgi:type II secretory pathway pseudopilin PulG